ncbi:MAG: NUDIX domain-containing protein [Peptococcaceae bacterium]|nr:NUDIX domain-containing protein [Peptococcaceae bacterium]
MKDAVAILIEKNGCYLFVQRPPGDLFAGYWSPPTGKVEPGEGQRQAVVREAMEELGISVIPLKKVWESVTVKKSFILHWWTTKPISLDISLNREELSGYTWIEPSGIRSLGKVFESHVRFFENIDQYI